jgi:pimeloyl-ACP methyl ester carboxylesterase
VKIVTLCVCLGIASINTTQLTYTHQEQVWMTVFVHGIMSIKPHISLANFMRFMTDQVQNSVYSKTVELMRSDPIFLQNQAMQELGLRPIETTIKPGNASGAMATMFEAISQFAYAGQAPENHYYTFGWSGLLSSTQRLNDAKIFYQALVEEIERFRQKGIAVKVRLIGYSHGGNVVLNLAQARHYFKQSPPVLIDEVVLLGTPIQRETDHLINDDMFKIIYQIYSCADRIQKLDFFSLNRFFSHRLFEPRKGFSLPNKLIQIRLSCTRNTRWYRSKPIPKKYMYRFGKKKIRRGKSRYFRDVSPGHAELWFFGWTPSNYRAHFPLNPLPAAALIPIIIKEAHDFEEKRWFEQPTHIDLRPEHGIMLIENQRSNAVLRIFRFLPHAEWRVLQEKVLCYKPESYTAERYEQAIRKAYYQACKYYNQKRKPLTKKPRRRLS